MMLTFTLKSLKTLWLGAIVCLCLCACGAASHAGVVSYTTGTGGTFDQSSSSTFTATNFGKGFLSDTAEYTSARIRFTWGGTAPNQPFTISGITANIGLDSVSFGDLPFPGVTTSGSNVSTNFLSFSPAFKADDLSTVSLTFTLPNLTVNDGWFLSASIQFSDNGIEGDNLNPTTTQTFTAVGSEVTPVPEPSSLAIVGLVGGFMAYRTRRKAMKSTKEVAAQ